MVPGMILSQTREIQKGTQNRKVKTHCVILGPGRGNRKKKRTASRHCFQTFLQLSSLDAQWRAAALVAAPASKRYETRARGRKKYKTSARASRPGGRTAFLLHLTAHLLESIELGFRDVLRFLRFQYVSHPHPICSLAERRPLGVHFA